MAKRRTSNGISNMHKKQRTMIIGIGNAVSQPAAETPPAVLNTQTDIAPNPINNAKTIFRPLLINLSVAVLLLICAIPAQAFTGSGSGTEIDPYIITTVEQLQEMNDDLDAHYVLGNNIDASATATWNDGAGFLPIAPDTDSAMFWYQGTVFSGTFDGSGYNIINLSINRPSEDFVGLFAITENARLENVVLDVNLSGHDGVGGIVGVTMSNTNITQCHSSGKISGNSGIGGLIGVTMSNTNITQCHSDGKVSGNGSIGGLVGSTDDGNISNCYSTGTVSGTSYIGGLAGYVGSIMGTSYEGSDFTNCYSTSTVTGGSCVGGLLGKNYSNNYITNCYCSGIVSGSSDVGGFLGYAVLSNTITNCFWDTETSCSASVEIELLNESQCVD